VDWREWRTTLIAPARTAAGNLTGVAVGLAVSPVRSAMIVIRIGEGDAVRMEKQAALEHIANMRQIVGAKLRSDGEP
jgi:hypothetical protein